MNTHHEDQSSSFQPGLLSRLKSYQSILSPVSDLTYTFEASAITTNGTPVTTKRLRSPQNEGKTLKNFTRLNQSNPKTSSHSHQNLITFQIEFSFSPHFYRCTITMHV